MGGVLGGLIVRHPGRSAVVGVAAALLLFTTTVRLSGGDFALPATTGFELEAADRFTAIITDSEESVFDELSQTAGPVPATPPPSGAAGAPAPEPEVVARSGLGASSGAEGTVMRSDVRGERRGAAMERSRRREEVRDGAEHRANEPSALAALGQRSAGDAGEDRLGRGGRLSEAGRGDVASRDRGYVRGVGSFDSGGDANADRAYARAGEVEQEESNRPSGTVAFGRIQGQDRPAAEPGPARTLRPTTDAERGRDGDDDNGIQGSGQPGDAPVRLALGGNLRAEGEGGERLGWDDDFVHAGDEEDERAANEQGLRVPGGIDEVSNGLVAGDPAAVDGRFDYRTATTSSPPAEAPYAQALVPEEPIEETEEEVRADASALQAASAFLASWSTVENVAFREPRGYWASTYVPGDPVIRALQQRLGAVVDGSGLELARRSRTVEQPFDAPDRSAIAVYLDADSAAAEGPTRMRVQVGLRGTDRRSGRRPAMNIGVVLDLREHFDVEQASAMRALLEALSEASDIGDQFSLVVAGRPGGVLIEPGTFGYGPVSVAATQALGETAEALSDAPTLSLFDAYAAAVQRVSASDDPNAPLGSSLVLVVTPGRIGGELWGLDRAVHQAAVDGIPTSVVGVGSRIDLSELDRLALSGQGNRRLLERAADAASLVDREISAAGRAVARALRLRIRLAAGVQLIDVLGSRRLDEAQAQRVRDAEQAVDQRIARSLGIQADRGEDEDGIQIVIPAFYAGDSHVILLDVVVPGPGPVADVTVRYKDLVHLRNGVGRAHLGMSRGVREPGPLQLNVTKNLVAFGLSETLQRAGALAADGHIGRATQEVAAFNATLSGLGALVPGFDTDPGLDTDLALLGDFISALASSDAWERPNEIADSLLYAGYLKLLEPPLDTDEVTP